MVVHGDRALVASEVGDFRDGHGWEGCVEMDARECLYVANAAKVNIERLWDLKGLSAGEVEEFLLVVLKVLIIGCANGDHTHPEEGGGIVVEIS